MEGPTQAGEEGGEQDVGHEGHDGDVHVRGVEVVAGGQEGVERRRVLLIVGELGFGVKSNGDEREGIVTHAGSRRGGGARLGARPGFMAPWKEDEEEFAEDVGGGNVEVVFQSWERDIAV